MRWAARAASGGFHEFAPRQCLRADTSCPGDSEKTGRPVPPIARRLPPTPRFTKLVFPASDARLVPGRLEENSV